MPQPKIRPDVEPAVSEPHPPRPAPAEPDWDWPQISAAGTHSPVRIMQAALHAEYLAQAEADRWGVRATIALVFGLCAAFWAMVYFIVAAMVG